MFTCVNCGNQVRELFKKYSPTVLKLMHCEKCNQVADKYIEYDPVIVMIDLVLLNERAYRHILYNSPFQSHWRLAIVLVLFEAYSGWATKKNEEALNSINMSHYDLFEGEGSFYFMCIQAILGSAVLFFFTYFLTWLRWKIHPLDKPKNYDNVILWKALVLSNCGKFLIIPSLIWGEIGTEIHSFFIMGYIFLSQLKTYAVVCNARKAGAGVIIFFGLMLKLYTYDILLLRREHAEKRLPCPRVLEVEEKFRSDLCVYRAMVAREYVNILLGYGSVHHFHHMSNKQHISSGERDTRLFEFLYRLSGRVVWIALRRHYGNMIEIELNRLFRTEAFNLMEHQVRGRAFIMPTPHENTVLHGFVQEESKLFSHSPLQLELLRNNDFCMMGIGYVNFKSHDPRIHFLEKMFDCPEEELVENGITIGILGLPRDNFDAMLVENVKHPIESDYDLEVALSAHFTALFKSDVQSEAGFRLPSISIKEPVPNNFPRNNVPTPDYHREEREDARIMWKMHVSHPLV